MSTTPEAALGDEVYRRLEKFTGTLAPTDEQTGRFFHIVSSIYESAKGNYRSLRAAFEEGDQKQVAWSCRNLLELAIYMKFVLRSKANADEFAADRLIDGEQIAEKLRELDLYLHPGLRFSALDSVIAEFKKQKQAEGVTRNGPRRTGDLAGKVGMKEEYDSVNKICSKFVHPTAWSLLTADEVLERFPEACSIFLSSGGNYLITIFADLKLHVEKWGLQWKA